MLNDFLMLSRCLGVKFEAAAVSGLREDLAAGKVAWDRVIALADRELVGPVLWYALWEKGLTDAIPADARDVMKRRYHMNTLLNGTIKREASQVIARCNEMDVVPIVLKGGAHLFESTPEEIGIRILRDVDMLVPEDEFDAIVSNLETAGYKLKEDEEEDWNYSYPPLTKPGEITPVEIHRLIGQQREILPPAEAWRDAVELPADGVKVKALSPTHRVFHNVFHSQIQDRGYELGIVWLRQLCDLASICTRHGDEIHWQGLRQLMARHGLENVLHSRMYMVSRLLGLPLSQDLPIPLKAKAHYYRCLLLLRWSSALWLTRFWASMTAPFKKHHIDLMYGCGMNPVRLNLYRVRHLFYILRKHRGTILRRAWVRRRYDV